MSVYVSESKIAAGVMPGEPRMVEAHEFEQCGVQIVYMDAIFDGAVAEFIGAAIGHAAADATTGEPYGKTVMIVITSGWIAASDGNFNSRCTSEFSATQHECVIEDSALGEVGEEGSDGAICFLPQSAVFTGDVSMGIPWLHIPMVALDDADTAFKESSGREQLSAVHGFGAIQLMGTLRLTAQIQRIGGFHLHAEGEFK